MSWLFDRLCEIAVADHVEVLIVADLSAHEDQVAVTDLLDVVKRSTTVPQMLVWVVSPESASDDGAVSSWLGEIEPSARRRWVIATDSSGQGLPMARVADRGLTISIGGIEPNAQVAVDDLSGVASIIDALVTLRLPALADVV